MPRTGRPPKPVELKRRLGNPGKRPLPAPIVAIAPVVATDQVPAFPTGDDMLAHVLDSGGRAWIGNTDAPLADTARRLWDSQILAEQRWRESPSPETFKPYHDLTKELHACLSSLGLDPVTRGRLGVAEVKAKTALELLRERQQARLSRSS